MKTAFLVRFETGPAEVLSVGGTVLEKTSDTLFVYSIPTRKREVFLGACKLAGAQVLAFARTPPVATRMEVRLLLIATLSKDNAQMQNWLRSRLRPAPRRTRRG